MLHLLLDALSRKPPSLPPPLSFLLLLFSFFRFEYIRCEERSVEDNSADVGTSWHLVRRRWLAWKAVAVNQGSQPSLIAPRIHYCAPPSYLTYPLPLTLPIATASLTVLHSLKRSCQLINCVWGGEHYSPFRFSLRANTSFRVTLFPRALSRRNFSTSTILENIREYFSLETRDSFFFSKRSQKERDLFLRRTAYFLDLYDYCLNFAGRCRREIREIREKRGWW